MKKGYHFIVCGDEAKKFEDVLKSLRLEIEFAATFNSFDKKVHYIVYVSQDELLYINFASKCDSCVSIETSKSGLSQIFNQHLNLKSR
jgi:hypothetical protein